MGGTFNRTKPSAIVREISSDYDKALSAYFGSATPDVAAARGLILRISQHSVPMGLRLRFSRSCRVTPIAASSRTLL